MRNSAKYKLFDHKRNQYIARELKIQLILEKINKYKIKWIHVRRIDRYQPPNDIMSRREECRTSIEETFGLLY
jgi:hypothetical protein